MLQGHSSFPSQMQKLGSVLTRDVIISEIKQGNIKISEPFTFANVGPVSVDLTLGNEFRTFKKNGIPIELNGNVDYRSPDITDLHYVEDSEGFVLEPFTSCLGITKEQVTLPPNMCGLLEGRSRMARVGLIIHFTAGIMMPGINNRQVLEICNFGSRPLKLMPGEKVCQFVFMRTEGEAQYNGAWANQKL